MSNPIEAERSRASEHTLKNSGSGESLKNLIVPDSGKSSYVLHLLSSLSLETSHNLSDRPTASALPKPSDKFKVHAVRVPISKQLADAGPYNFKNTKPNRRSLQAKLPGSVNCLVSIAHFARGTFRSTFMCVSYDNRTTFLEHFHHHLSSSSHFQTFALNNLDLYCTFSKKSCDQAINFRRQFCGKKHLTKFRLYTGK